MSRGSRKLALLFLLVVLPAAGTLIWLGVILLDMDRALWVQSAAERRQATASDAAHALDRWLSSLVDAPNPGPDTIRFELSRSAIQPLDGLKAAWLPEPNASKLEEAGVFAPLEQAEYRGSPDDALAGYKAFARSSNKDVRAGALLRIARIHRSRGNIDKALVTYRLMTAIEGVTLYGMPASLSLAAPFAPCSKKPTVTTSRQRRRLSRAILAKAAGVSIEPHGR
jgi:hypothetical protein